MQARVDVADGKCVEAEKGCDVIKNKLAESTEHYRLASEQAQMFQTDLDCASIELKQARQSELKACSQLVETQSGMENATREFEKLQLTKDEIRTKLETAETHGNYLTHQLHTSNSQMETLQKCLDENTVK